MNFNYIFSKISFLRKFIVWAGLFAVALASYVVLKQQHNVLSPAARIIFDSITSVK